MNILEVKNLKVHFGASVAAGKAVDGVSFNIEKGKVFGIVGESGSGKTLTALSILRLISRPGNIVDGAIVFNGLDLLKLKEDDMLKIRGSRISMVFQEPASSFNPVFTIGEQIVETVIKHQGVDANKARDITLKFMRRAHIHDAERIFHDYPHQVSGGTKQRAMIAMALVNSPEIVLLDEPTTALDVTIQAQILDLLKEIIREEKLSALFISHDLGIVSRMCENVAVMRKGKIVESGITKDVLRDPKEAYTVSLLQSAKALS